MNHSIVCFTTFNPWRLTHWIVAIAQLAMRKRYWYVVHCAPLIQTVRGMSTLEIRLASSRLMPYQPDEYRELFFYPHQCSDSRLLTLVSSGYLLNCADITYKMCRLTPTEYPSPASLYELALGYTIHHSSYTRLTNGSTARANVAVPSANYQGDNG